MRIGSPERKTPDWYRDLPQQALCHFVEGGKARCLFDLIQMQCFSEGVILRKVIPCMDSGWAVQVDAQPKKEGATPRAPAVS